MKIVSLDLHEDASQMVVTDEDGRVLDEMRVPTETRQLRRAVSAVDGDTRVVFEEGPLSMLARDALEDVAEEVVSADPAHNGLIARDENSDDESDARHLATLLQVGAVREVYVPGEPHRSLRSVLNHRLGLQKSRTAVKNRIKALARRNGVATKGKSLYRAPVREKALERIDNVAMRWQMQSLWRQLDMLGDEVARSRREIRRLAGRIPATERLRTVPGVGLIISATIVAWIVDPHRFRDRSALSAYAGLGLGQGVTNWQPVGPARASRRGNRRLKKALFMAATCAAGTDTALGFRYRVRKRQGWSTIRSKRDVARKILHLCSALWKKGDQYKDSLVNGPQIPRRA